MAVSPGFSPPKMSTVKKDELKKYMTITGEGKGKVYQCGSCSHPLPAHSDRWISHMKGCNKTPIELRNKLQGKKRPASQVFVETESGVLLPQGAAGAPSGRPTGSVPSIPSKSANVPYWTDKVSGLESKRLDAQFAKIFYSSGVPFRFADNEELIEFVRMLRPAYQLPSSKTVAGSLLRAASKKLTGGVKSLIVEQPQIHLVSDGWSSMKNDHFVNHVLLFPDRDLKPVLFDTTCTGEESQTAANICADLSSVIDKVLRAK